MEDAGANPKACAFLCHESLTIFFTEAHTRHAAAHMSSPPVHHSELVLILVTMYLPFRDRARASRACKEVLVACAVSRVLVCTQHRAFERWKRRTIFPRRVATVKRRRVNSWSRRRLHHEDDPVPVNLFA